MSKELLYILVLISYILESATNIGYSFASGPSLYIYKPEYLSWVVIGVVIKLLPYP